MKRNIRNMMLAASLLAFSVLSCSKPETGTEEPGEERPGKEESLFPEAPEEVVEANLFRLDFFTELSDAPYMEGKSANDIAACIRSTTGKKPLLTLIDRMDFVTGKVHPSVLIGRTLSMHPFFAQCARTGEKVTPGTSILTIYPISDYDGSMIDRDSFISGCKLRAPLQQPQDLTFYTSRFETMEQVKGLLGLKAPRLRRDGIVTGTVRKGLSAEMKEYVEKELGCRLELVEEKDTDHDLYLMIPAAFVCRGIEKESAEGNIVFYRISIEKLV